MAGMGITSACAEKRHDLRAVQVALGNYLRMRGEEVIFEPPAVLGMELPPHARRREAFFSIGHGALGITSACAEKSLLCAWKKCIAWNYLRMRGEEPGKIT